MVGVFLIVFGVVSPNCPLLAAVGKSPRPRVVIVGAGLSGMTAAYELKTRYHINSEVYEARGRVGGRTWSIHGPAGTVDLGGSFINTTDTALRGLIKNLGLKEVSLPDLNDTWNILRNESGRYEVFRSSQIYGAFKGTFLRIKKDQNRLGIKDFALPSGALSSSAKKYDRMSIQGYLDSIHAPRAFSDFTQAYFGGFFGRRLKEIDALQFLTEISISPEKNKFHFYYDVHNDEALGLKGGTQQICLKIEKRLHNVHKNWVLTTISSSDQKHFALTFETPDGIKVVDADYVIVTIPFVVLRNKVQIKVARFPPAVTKAIKSTLQGMNSKMILDFREPIWMSRYHQSGSVSTAWFLTWPNGDNKRKGPASLTVYFNVKQHFSHQYRLRDKVLRILEKVYPGISKQLTGMKIADWPSYQFSQGSFSGALAPGQWAHRWPSVAQMKVGHLVFAGEHLSGNLRLIGYMNGAVTTGDQAAQIVAKRYP